jgi:type II secretory pathway pseudopilin PulG
MDPLAPRALLPSPSRILRSGGFTYLGLIILIAIIGITSAASLQVGSILARRAAEEELLDIGSAFRAALVSYSAATPVGQATTPQSVQDLLKDPRYPNPLRHLRKLYADPLTGLEEWGFITIASPGGTGIVGVYSLSQGMPIKVGNFSAPFQHFQGKTSYRDWKFMALPQPELSALPGAAPPTLPVAPLPKAN